MEGRKECPVPLIPKSRLYEVVIIRAKKRKYEANFLFRTYGGHGKTLDNKILLLLFFFLRKHSIYSGKKTEAAHLRNSQSRIVICYTCKGTNITESKAVNDKPN